jgi:hypothetical protein
MGTATEGRIIENSQILLVARFQVGSKSPACRPALAVRVGDNDAAVDRESFAAHQPLGHAARHDGFE